MVDFNGINNPELKAKFDKIFADGKVELDEVKSLTEKEQEALMEGLSGKVSEDCLKEISALIDKSNESPSFWDNPKEWFKSDKTSTAAKVGVGILGLGAAVGLGMAAASVFGVTGVAILGGAALLGLTSCTPDEPDIPFGRVDDEKPEVTVYVSSVVNLNLDVTIEKTNDENVLAILKFIEEFGGKVNNCLEEIITKLDNIGMSLERITSILVSMAGDNQELKALLTKIIDEVKNGNNIGEENNKVLTAILSKMNSLENDNADVKKLLSTIIAKIDIGNDMSAKQSRILVAVLNAINKLDANVSKKLDVLINDVNKIGDNSLEVLTNILNEIGDIKNNQKDYTPLLEAVLVAIETNTQNDKDMHEETKAMFNSFISNAAKFSDALMKALANLTSSVNKMDANTQKALKEIIEKMGQMQSDNQANFEAVQANFAAVLAALAEANAGINENNKTAKDGLAVLTQILAKLDTMDVNAQNNFKTLISKIVQGNDINANILAKLDNILAQLNKMEGTSQANFAEVLAAILQADADIKEGNVTSQNALEVVTKILEKLGEMDSATQANFKTVIEQITKNNNISQETLNKINNIVAQLKTITENQANVLVALTTIDANIANKFDYIINNFNKVQDNCLDVLTNILNEIKEVKNNQVDYTDLLDAIKTRIEESIKNNKDMHEETKNMFNAFTNNAAKFGDDVMKALAKLTSSVDKMSTTTQAQLATIIEKMGEMQGDNKANFAAVLAALAEANAGINENNKTAKDGLEVLTQILAKLNDMDAATQNNFKTLINEVTKGNNINEAILNKLSNISSQLNEISESQANFFAEVAVKFGDLNVNQQTNLDKVLDAIANNTSAINKNTDVANGIYALLTQLLGKVDDLKNDTSVNLDAILEAIGKISVGGNGGQVDLSGIESLLKQLLAQGAKNNEVLNSIDAKIGTLSVVIGGLKVEWTDASDDIKKLLNAILNKIPEGCHCQPTDLSEIIDLLKQLVQASKDDGREDPKHEGILDDLDKFFG